MAGSATAVKSKTAPPSSTTTQPSGDDLLKDPLEVKDGNAGGGSLMDNLKKFLTDKVYSQIEPQLEPDKLEEYGLQAYEAAWEPLADWLEKNLSAAPEEITDKFAEELDKVLEGKAKEWLKSVSPELSETLQTFVGENIVWFATAALAGAVTYIATNQPIPDIPKIKEKNFQLEADLEGGILDALTFKKGVFKKLNVAYQFKNGSNVDVKTSDDFKNIDAKGKGKFAIKDSYKDAKGKDVEFNRLEAEAGGNIKVKDGDVDSWGANTSLLGRFGEQGKTSLGGNYGIKSDPSGVTHNGGLNFASGKNNLKLGGTYGPDGGWTGTGSGNLMLGKTTSLLGNYAGKSVDGGSQHNGDLTLKGKDYSMFGKGMMNSGTGDWMGQIGGQGKVGKGTLGGNLMGKSVDGGEMYSGALNLKQPKYSLGLTGSHNTATGDTKAGMTGSYKSKPFNATGNLNYVNPGDGTGAYGTGMIDLKHKNSFGEGSLKATGDTRGTYDVTGKAQYNMGNVGVGGEASFYRKQNDLGGFDQGGKAGGYLNYKKDNMNFNINGGVDGIGGKVNPYIGAGFKWSF